MIDMMKHMQGWRNKRRN